MAKARDVLHVGQVSSVNKETASGRIAFDDLDGHVSGDSQIIFPAILSDDFSFKFFMSLINDTPLRSMSAKEFLATKNRIPGLDNSILHEILWEAEINPKTKMVTWGESDFVRIYNAIKKVFPAVIASGGKDTDKDLYGQFGKYETHVSKNTLGTPCERCGGLVMKEAFLCGAVYYCPQCQPYIKI